MKRHVLILAMLLFAGVNALIAQMIVKDDANPANVLMQVNDEGTLGSITLPSGSAPGTTDDKLYNNGGILSWSGNPLATGSAGWSLTGNSGTTPETHFLGTTDNQALELKVNNSRVLRLEPNANGPNFIGGYIGNGVTTGLEGVTILGGGSDGSNLVTDKYGTIGGGARNQAGDDAGTTDTAGYATVGGGKNNTASDWYTTVGGGGGNSASADQATVGGGIGNEASGSCATVGGGSYNSASDSKATVSGGENNTSYGNATVGGGYNNKATISSATIPGGHDNTASGEYSFAAGRRAKANHKGAFVWGDATNEDVASTGNNQFIIRASGGVGIGTDSPSAALDVSSTTQGFLPPRMTTTQRDAISSPVAGLLIFNTTTSKMNYYDGSAWQEM
jgi:hypothetical protein